MAEVEFIYNGTKTIIQCNLNEKIKDISKRFKDKINLTNKNINYTYNGNLVLNEELKFEDIVNNEDKIRKKMSFIVFDNLIETKDKDIIKSNEIICPECKENIRMNINEYKINLLKCKNGHNKENILLDEFEETQNINLTDIICNICKNNNKSISYDNIFYKCLTCNINICPLCKSSHDKNHIIINYDEKYYICNEHNEKYMLYCEDCNKNLCTLCDGHKEHKRIFFVDILPKKEDLIKKKQLLKSTIDDFNSEIKVLISRFNEVTNKINIYYKIIEDMINNYDNKNRNYEIIYNLNQIQNNNINEELKKIIRCNNIIEKYNNILNIYKKMNHDEINLIYNIKGLKELYLFGSNFVSKNKNNLKLIIDGKEQDIIYKYNIENNNNKDILEIKLKGITNVTYMNNMFQLCNSLSPLSDLTKWNTSHVYKMGYLFCNCNSLLSLPNISNWNTSNVTYMSNIFNGCSSLKFLPDISKWDTSNVSDMSEMFSSCNSLLSLPDISKWNISNVNDMNCMFADCSSLKSLPDISKWNTSKLNIMDFMFSTCSSLLSLPDISKWNISNVTNMNDMFYGCKDSLNIPSKFKSIK